LRAGVFSAAAGQPAYRAYCHIVITEDLTAQSDLSKATRFQYIAFRDGHSWRFTLHKFDSAGGAARVSAASMQLINAGILLQGEHQPFAGGDVKSANIFHGQLWHIRAPFISEDMSLENHIAGYKITQLLRIFV
jgi:hypothetical protein